MYMYMHVLKLFTHMYITMPDRSGDLVVIIPYKYTPLDVFLSLRFPQH